MSSAGARQFLAQNLNFSPLQFFGLQYFLHHKFSEQTDQLESCLAFLKTAEPKPLTMNTLNSMEGWRTCSTAWQAAKHFFFFFQQQEDRSFTLKAELMPRCKRQTAETDATLIKTFQQSTTGNLQGFILSIDLQLQTQPKKKKKKEEKDL